jgi:hypothetical protein
LRFSHAIALAGVVSCVPPLVGCDRDDDSGGRSKPILELVGDPDSEPVDAQLEDSACQSDPTNYVLSETSVHGWNGDQVSSSMVSIDGIVSNKSLESSAVKLTTYGDRYERVCDWSKPSGLECTKDNGTEKGWTLQDSSGPLRVCKDRHTYGRMTYEGVGLAAISYLTNAHERYAQLAPEAAVALKPLYLSVLPEFIDFYDNYEQNGQKKRLQLFITHNMAYFPSGPMIAVFPEGQQYVGKVPGYFWESAFVLGHEFGHHVDTTRNAQQLTAMGLSWSPTQHGYREMGELGHRQLSMASGGSARAKILGSVSEAFADLAAYYGEGGSSTTLTGLPCFGKNRDISQAAFSNGDAKMLSEDRLSTLMSPPSDEDRTCGIPRYSDIHNIGAIIAHAVDQTLAAVTAQRTDFEAGSAGDYDERYRLTLAWLDAVTTLALTADATDVIAMAQPIGMALQKVAEAALDGGYPLVQGGSQLGKRDVCRVALELLPALRSAPFADESGACPE